MAIWWSDTTEGDPRRHEDEWDSIETAILARISAAAEALRERSRPGLAAEQAEPEPAV